LVHQGDAIKNSAGGKLYRGKYFPHSPSKIAAGKYGMGPTGVALSHEGPCTFGFSLQPYLVSGGLGTPAAREQHFSAAVPGLYHQNAWTFTVNSESTYDWRGEDWSVSLNFVVSKLLKIEGQPISVGVGTRYWAESPQGAQPGWGGRFVVTFLFPK
jgi:hypothetical protein